MQIHSTTFQSIYSAFIQDKAGNVVWFDSTSNCPQLISKTREIMFNSVESDGGEVDLSNEEFHRMMLDTIEDSHHLNPRKVVEVGEYKARLFVR